MVNKKEHTPNNAENVYLQRKYTIQCKKTHTEKMDVVTNV